MKGFASYGASHQMQIMGKPCVVVEHLTTTKKTHKIQQRNIFPNQIDRLVFKLGNMSLYI